MNLTETSPRNPTGVLVAVGTPVGERVRVDSRVGGGGLRRVDRHQSMGLDAGPPNELSLGQAMKVQRL